MKRYLTTSAAAMFLAAGAAHAATVDFAGFDNGDFVTGPTNLGGGIVGTVSATGGTGDAVIYDTTQTGGQDPDLEGPFANSDNLADVRSDFGNSLTVQEVGSPIPDDTIGFTLFFSFASEIDVTSLTILDSDPGETVTVSADGFADVIFGGGGDNTFTTVGLSFTDVDAFSITFSGSGAVGEFEAFIPLPASALLLLGGIGAIAATRRSKRS